MAKKQYSRPQAEKVDFDYVESVVACPSGCTQQGPFHWDHQGFAYGSCGASASNGGNSGNSGNSGNGGNGGNGGNEGGNSYWAPGWGLGC